jgi:hypothetical protein
VAAACSLPGQPPGAQPRPHPTDEYDATTVDGTKPSLAVDLTVPSCLLPECQVPSPFTDRPPPTDVPAAKCLRRPPCLLPGTSTDRRACCRACCQVPSLIAVLAAVPAARCLRRSPCLLSCLLPSACCQVPAATDVRTEKQRPTEQPSSRDRTSRATKPGQVPPP